MALISDSDAVLDIRRILPQHQSAITLLNTILQNPGVTDCFWLDLACGKDRLFLSSLKIFPMTTEKNCHIGVRYSC